MLLLLKTAAPRKLVAWFAPGVLEQSVERRRSRSCARAYLPDPHAAPWDEYGMKILELSCGTNGQGERRSPGGGFFDG